MNRESSYMTGLHVMNVRPLRPGLRVSSISCPTTGLSVEEFYAVTGSLFGVVIWFARILWVCTCASLIFVVDRPILFVKVS